MSAENETIADIVAWIRKRPCMFGYRDMNDLANRIEAVAKREMSKIASKNGADFGQFGNAAKMREALESAKKKALYIAKNYTTPNSLTGNILELLAHLNAALAEPPRQCDVGTAEEQAERYGRYCDKFTSDIMHCETCPCCGKIPFGKCEFAWAQMPYEEGGEL